MRIKCMIIEYRNLEGKKETREISVAEVKNLKNSLMIFKYPIEISLLELKELTYEIEKMGIPYLILPEAIKVCHLVETKEED